MGESKGGVEWYGVQDSRKEGGIMVEERNVQCFTVCACLSWCICVYISIGIFVCKCTSLCMHMHVSVCVNWDTYACMYVCARRMNDVPHQRGSGRWAR